MVLDDQPWQPPVEGFYATDAYSQEAVRRIREHTHSMPEKPMFLYLAYTAPHWPLHAPEDVIQRWLPVYQDGWDRIHADRSRRVAELGLIEQTPSARPSNVPAWSQIDDKALWTRRMATHAAMVEIMDRGIGEVIAALRATRRLDNTLIVFMSDNGASHEDVSSRGLHRSGTLVGARGSFDAMQAPWSWASNAPFRGTKETVFEGGINTPCIVSWPGGGVRPGHVSRDIGHVVDLVPTVLAAAGLEVSAVRPASAPRLRGKALRFEGDAPVAQDRTLFFEIFENRALLRGDWKALRHRNDPAWSIYDLKNDPAEAYDLASTQPVRLAEMRQAWLDTARSIGVRGLEPDS
jgi:arylsulfatase A-like enzyme